MSDIDLGADMSPLRGRLSGFDHAYKVAVQRRQSGGARQFILRTGNPLQPFRISRHPPREEESILALVA